MNKRILIIKLSAFGDLIQAEGAIHDIRNHHRDAEIIAMTTPAYKKIMARCPWVDSVFVDRREPRWRLDKLLALRAQLRQLKPDLVYDLQQVGRTNFYYTWLMKGTPWLGIAQGCHYQSPNMDHLCSMERFAAQLPGAGVPVNHTLRPDVGWMADDVSNLLSRCNIRQPYVVLIPGASASHARKRWPGYDQLAAWFQHQGITVITVPGPDEIELCRSFVNATMLMNGENHLDFFQLAGVLKKAAFVIGNDTGPTHLASHLRVPGLALFSKHFPPTRTGIQYSLFSWLEVEDLSRLSQETVRDKVFSLFFAPRSCQSINQ